MVAIFILRHKSNYMGNWRLQIHNFTMFFSYDEHAHIMMPVRDVENLKSNQQCMDSFICLLEVHVVCDDIKLLF